MYSMLQLLLVVFCLQRPAVIKAVENTRSKGRIPDDLKKRVTAQNQRIDDKGRTLTVAETIVLLMP